MNTSDTKVGLHPADLSDEKLMENCDFTRTRRSGPGGQNRNKVETAVVLDHRPTGLRSEANETRSQAENLKAALFRLRLLMALKIRVRRNESQSPSTLWKSRLRSGKILVSPEHQDFPSLVAEALDVIAEVQFDVKIAADVLGCSSSQLVKFLKLEPRAFALVNQTRRENGLRVLL